jgi:hypothetical protein
VTRNRYTGKGSGRVPSGPRNVKPEREETLREKGLRRERSSDDDKLASQSLGSLRRGMLLIFGCPLLPAGHLSI